MRLSASLLLAALVGAGGAAALSLTVSGDPSGAGSRADDSGRREVSIKAVSFSPKALVVQRGDTVVWRNADIVRHNVVSVDRFESDELATGDTFSWIPDVKGLIRYRCTIHQRMRGELTVQ